MGKNRVKNGLFRGIFQRYLYTFVKNVRDLPTSHFFFHFRKEVKNLYISYEKKWVFDQKGFMRYYSQKPEEYTTYYGTVYICRHPLYTRCTLFSLGDTGLAIVQQRFDPATKHTWWNEIDPWLNDILYRHPNFPRFYQHHAAKPENGLYPTVTLRHAMWSLRLKPLKRERWETLLDRPFL